MLACNLSRARPSTQSSAMATQCNELIGKAVPADHEPGVGACVVQFAQCAKKVRNKAVVNHDLHTQDLMKLRAEIKSLQRRLEARSTFASVDGACHESIHKIASHFWLTRVQRQQNTPTRFRIWRVSCKPSDRGSPSRLKNSSACAVPTKRRSHLARLVPRCARQARSFRLRPRHP